jgi:hypothetical protein
MSVVESYDKDASTYNSTWTHYLEHSLARPLEAKIDLLKRSTCPLRLLDLDNITVIGVDPANEMLAEARKIINTTKYALEFHCESALTLTCIEPASIDIVVSTNALNFMSPDITLPLAQINRYESCLTLRVLQCDGKLVLTDLSADYRVIRFICWGLEWSSNGYAVQAYTCDEVERACMEVGLEKFKISLWWGLLFGVFVKS